MATDDFQELVEIISNITDKVFLEKFLKEILTKNEIKELSSRWALVKMLDQQIPQREIAKKLKISLCKITRGSRELKREGSAFKDILKKFKKGSETI